MTQREIALLARYIADRTEAFERIRAACLKHPVPGYLKSNGLGQLFERWRKEYLGNLPDEEASQIERLTLAYYDFPTVEDVERKGLIPVLAYLSTGLKRPRIERDRQRRIADGHLRGVPQ